ncbi:MAG: BtrH N-terminal domain-containing protein [Gammaproteobacteria bacterium]|nr:BtrH N-terminal domain-containing protein [Gammaproteobacteria bacterium]
MIESKAFTHYYSAHCESGVISSLLRNQGCDLSEPMVFGLSGALNFAYLPFVKVAGMPLVAYRSLPKSIIKNIEKRLHIPIKKEQFKSPLEAQKKLDELLQQGKTVGLQTSVFYLPYFPEEMRFHFNAHNLIAYGKKAKDYLISDPVFENPVTAAPHALLKARFAKGPFAPKGFCYYIDAIPKNLNLPEAIQKSIKKTAHMMLKTPVPIAGIRSMGLLAKRLEKLSHNRAQQEYTRLFLGHIIRMQEEIGTGGGGFRFIYAAFLKESSTIHPAKDLLEEAASLMTDAGDTWRNFALSAAKASQAEAFDLLAKPAIQLRAAQEKEKKVYALLQQLTLKPRR